MLDAFIPVYQKHLTKGDVDALVVFYGSPTGQKVLKEMPAMMGEGTLATMPMMRKHIEAMQQRMQLEVAEMLKEAHQSGKKKDEATAN